MTGLGVVKFYERGLERIARITNDHLFKPLSRWSHNSV